MTPVDSAPALPPAPRFNFNRELWQRFITIAQPYFYPTGPAASVWVFFGLLVVQLVMVICLAFFAATGGTLLGKALFPDFFAKVAAGLVKQVDGLLASPALPLATAGLAVGGILFWLVRRQLQQRWLQWGLLGLLLFLSFAVNGANVSISFIFRFIDTALNERQEPTFWRFLFIYGGLIVAAIPILVLYRYVRLKLGLLWREWLTHKLVGRYFQERSYYTLNSNADTTAIDNPDQRITEDVKSFTATTLSFLLDVLDSILTLISFTAILYSISKALTVGLLVYATLGTGLAVLAGRRLISINFNQLRLEANFRYSMVHVRDNAESIAFYRGEPQEIRHILERFRQALRNFDLLIIWQALIDLFQYGYNYFTRIVPYVIVAPLYFAGKTDLGTITQAYIAFSQVLGALSLVANQIQSISSFAAGVERLGAFSEVLQDGRPAGPQITTQVDGRIALEHLTLVTPNQERTLVEDLSLALGRGERLVIVGASGSGKSSLLRAIAGLWTRGTGTIVRPEIDQTLFLPQKPYMTLGTLRDQLLYPQNQTSQADPELKEILNQVNLQTLLVRYPDLSAVEDWSRVLSLGEQQRLAFARVLLTQPRYAILDEASSALDVANERHLYGLLQQLGIVYVSVGHRNTLLAYHDQVLELDGMGGWQVCSVSQYGEQLAAGA
ncbi:MAG: ABC transporter ATP-binding protein/permease [Gloeomargaritaceae cyanobacterium C42_A2020_066]|nr:ABC transporter ATP-binding protein/permease [Gloeomargaritaceae cyanobacterium C42_A2020_066]